MCIKKAPKNLYSENIYKKVPPYCVCACVYFISGTTKVLTH